MIDPNEAPEGYRAEEPVGYEFNGSGFCEDCAFRFDERLCARYSVQCETDKRKDGHEVIFKKIEEKGE